MKCFVAAMAASVIVLLIVFLWVATRKPQSKNIIVELTSARTSETSHFHPTNISRADFLALMSEEHRRQSEVLPKFTATGCLFLKTPKDLKRRIVEEYRRKRSTSTTSAEKDAALVEFSSEEQRPKMTWITGSGAELDLRKWMAGALEQWSGISRLNHSATYGVRSYQKGSKLTTHTDRYGSHVISAIIHVERKGMVKDWPLHVLPHRASHAQAVFFSEEDDCLFYESCTVPHGRLEALDGNEYSNIFLHFMPDDWGEKAERLMAHCRASEKS
jgi:hypothetical protein